MRRFFSKQLLLALIVATVMCGGRTSAQDFPLIGWFSGSGNDFSGTAYPIGRFNGEFDPTTGTAEWTTRRGTLFNQTTDFDLVFRIWRNLYYYEQSVVFTDGTRRFRNVTGTAEFRGFINVRSGRYFGYIDGELTRNRVPPPPPADPPPADPPSDGPPADGPPD